MQCPSHKAALGVGTPIQMVNVQLKVNNATRAMVLIIILLCAKRRDAGNPGRSSREALSPTSAAPAMDVMPAAPHVGTEAETMDHTAIPGPLPAVLHVVQPMAHLLSTPHVPKSTQPPTGTTRIP